MKEPTYLRKGRVITHVATQSVDKYKSYNAAKRRSRELSKGGEVVRLVKE